MTDLQISENQQDVGHNVHAVALGLRTVSVHALKSLSEGFKFTLIGNSHGCEPSEKIQHEQVVVNLRKNLRRRMINVLSEDTIILTIHPSFQSDANGWEDISLSVANNEWAIKPDLKEKDELRS